MSEFFSPKFKLFLKWAGWKDEKLKKDGEIGVAMKLCKTIMETKNGKK